MSEAGPKKRNLVAFKLTEISVVDKGAQEGARIVLTKRHQEEKPVLAKAGGYKPLFTTVDSGHQHFVPLWEEKTDGNTDCAAYGLSDGYSKYHSHQWIRLEDGSVIISAADGHTHRLMTADEMAVMATPVEPEKETPPPAAADEIAGEAPMLEADVSKAMTDENAKLKKQLDDSAERISVLEKSRADNEAKIAKAVIEKRAVALFKNLPGNDEVLGAMLGAVESIVDESIRKGAMAAIAAGNEALKSSFVRKGSASHSTDEDPDDFAAGFAKFAEANKDKGNAPILTKMYLATKEGSALYAKSRGAE